MLRVNGHNYPMNEEISLTCPDVEVDDDETIISDDRFHPASDQVRVYSYDMDGLIARLMAARERLRQAGYPTAWSRNVDGQGNCGAVHRNPSAVCDELRAKGHVT